MGLRQRLVQTLAHPHVGAQPGVGEVVVGPGHARRDHLDGVETGLLGRSLPALLHLVVHGDREHRLLEDQARGGGSVRAGTGRSGVTSGSGTAGGLDGGAVAVCGAGGGHGVAGERDIAGAHRLVLGLRLVRTQPVERPPFTRVTRALRLLERQRNRVEALSGNFGSRRCDDQLAGGHPRAAGSSRAAGRRR